MFDETFLMLKEGKQRDKLLQHFKDDSTPGVIYQGFSLIGAGTNEARWMISLTVVTDGLSYTIFANDGRSNCIWNNRASYFTGQSGFVNTWAIDFDGLNDYATVENPTFLSELTGDYTAHTWIRPDFLDSSLDTIWIVGSSSSATPILGQLQINSSSAYFAARDDAGVVGAIQPSVSLSLNEWYLIGIRKKLNSGTGNYDYAMFINGVPVGSMSLGVSTTTTNLFTLGVTRRNTIDSASHYSGAVDETSFIKRALSDSEMLDVFGSYRANDLSVFGDDLVGWWSEPDYPYIKDRVFNNDLEMINMAQSSIIIAGI